MIRPSVLVVLVGLLAGCGGAASVAAPVPATSSSPAPTLDRQAFCERAVKHSAAAVAAIAALNEHPDGKGLTVEQFSGPRADLSTDAASAPADLQPLLEAHVTVLDQVVAVLTTGQNDTIRMGELRDASVGLLTACAG